MRLVYASPVPYGSFTQRPHRFVRYVNERSGGRTLWLDPYPGRLPGPGDLRRPRTRVHDQPMDDVEIIRPVGVDPVMSFSLLRRLAWKSLARRVDDFVSGHDWLLVFGRPSYLALHLLRITAPTASCYDAMDDFPEFYSGLSRWMNRRIELKLAQGVDNLLVASEALRRKFDRLGLAAELLRNGFDAEQQPAREIARRHPVFGYVGTLGSWFDWKLIAEMARQLPEVRFDLIGPVLAPAPSLPANVRLCGECDYEVVQEKLRGFTAGLIPFKVNRLTAAVDPIKYYEYRSAGLPVISTRFGDMSSRESEPSVCLVDALDDHRALLRRIGRLKRCSDETLKHFRAANNWRSRFQQSRFLRESVGEGSVPCAT